MGTSLIAADTWGISGPLFLVYFLTAAVVAFIVSGLIRRMLSTVAVTRRWEPDAEQVAYYSGGPRQAVLAVLARLRTEGVVSSTQGNLAVTGPVPAGPSPLTWAVYQTAQRGVRGRQVDDDPAVKAALADMHAVLVANGWLLSKFRRFLIRTLGTVPVIVVLVAGFARMAAGMANDKPVIGITILTIVLGFITLLMFIVGAEQSRVAEHAVEEMRYRYSHLRPWNNPSLATYGAPAAAMSVGLFGAMALMTMDPGFANDVERVAYASGGGSSGSGCGSGSSGGDSGGGGGCGGGGGGCGG